MVQERRSGHRDSTRIHRYAIPVTMIVNRLPRVETHNIYDIRGLWYRDLDLLGLLLLIHPPHPGTARGSDMELHPFSVSHPHRRGVHAVEASCHLAVTR